MPNYVPGKQVLRHVLGYVVKQELNYLVKLEIEAAEKVK